MTILEAMVAVVMSLTGSHWVAANNTHQTVEFTESRISGNAGCNQFFGSFEQNGGHIKVQPLATTRMACSPEKMNKEHTFLTQLQSAKQVDMQANMLVLKNSDGEILVTLNRKNMG
jgi:heat shock protein HslJ